MKDIKCTRCNCDMHKVRNWNNMYIGDSNGVYFETFTLFAYRIKNIFTKGTGFKKIKPAMYICRQCGKFELYFDDKDILTILDIDSDPDYTNKSNTHDNKEDDCVDLTKMSRMKKRALERKNIMCGVKNEEEN